MKTVNVATLLKLLLDVALNKHIAELFAPSMVSISFAFELMSNMCTKLSLGLILTLDLVLKLNT